MKFDREGYKQTFTGRGLRSFINAIIILVLAVIFQYYSSAYSVRVSSNFVHDILLDNLPVINLNAIVVEGALGAIAGSIILLLFKPRYINFSLKTGAIFIATRAIFVSATHLGIYPGQIGPDPIGFFDHLYTGFGLEAGYFFSAHTGLPLLMALIYWREKVWRNIYIALGIIFGIAVLFAHVHYTIDVLAAPYMSYGIFKMSQYFFKEDYQLIASK